jgi:hypothetical protein
MAIDTDGHTTWVVVETRLPQISKERQNLITKALDSVPELWFTPSTTGSPITGKAVAIGALLILGAILIFRRS